MVKECAVTLGSHEFMRTRRKGDIVLIVSKGRNHNGSFISLSKFGRDKRRGLLVILEGRKGEGWRNFGDTLMELFSSSVSSTRTSHAIFAKKNRGDGGAPLTWAGGARSYSEVLKKVLPRAVRDVVPGAISSEDVQRYGGEDSRLLGLNEESVFRMLIGLEEKVGIILDEISYLKRCVKGKAELKDDVGRKSGPCPTGIVLGHGTGHASGPKKVWRAVATELSGQASKSKISGQELRQAPVAPITTLLATLSAQKLPTTSVDHPGEPVKVLQREDLEEGEILVEPLAQQSLRNAFASSSLGMLVENGHSEPCVVVEGSEAV
ncbi:hypothetical protein F2P56_011573 [Juglans regia]|uniref:Uncharacterized protein n=1 Tax=Juglans regia TaxID=51240 RepID=A0A833XU61_JUGRE|nr:hypothetical protein F2P56_011573 [Juglans regia]